MISTGELRKGVVIELDGDLWQILDYHHIKMGRGSAQVRIKLRNVNRNRVLHAHARLSLLLAGVSLVTPARSSMPRHVLGMAGKDAAELRWRVSPTRQRQLHRP